MLQNRVCRSLILHDRDGLSIDLQLHPPGVTRQPLIQLGQSRLRVDLGFILLRLDRCNALRINDHIRLRILLGVLLLFALVELLQLFLAIDRPDLLVMEHNTVIGHRMRLRVLVTGQ
ncbi:hypothetical protein D3C77_384630 [compost metagenome]